MIAEAIKSGEVDRARRHDQGAEEHEVDRHARRGLILQEKRGYKYQQWLDIPYVTFQITAVKQPVGETKLVQDPGKPLDSRKS